MKVERNGIIYNVVEYFPDTQEVCVEDEFDFAEEPYKRIVKMWWFLKDCEIVEE